MINLTRCFLCNDFKQLSPADRLSFAKMHRLCFNCLKSGHMSDKCRLDRVCSVEGCARKHTKFLHQPNYSSEPSNQNSRDNNPRKSNDNPTEAIGGPRSGFVGANIGLASNSTGAGATSTRIALPIVPVIVRAKGDKLGVPTFALLDSGSTSSFCSEELVNQLKICGKQQKLSLTTLERENSVIDCTVVNLDVQGLHSNYVINMRTVFTKRVIPVRNDNMATQQDVEKWPHLSDLKLPQVGISEVGLLIGQDNPDALIPLEVRLGKKGEPYATRTNLGWTLSGPLNKGQGRFATTHFVCSNDSLESQLKEFWKVDSNDSLVNDTKGMSVNDKKVISEWEDNICHENGHYTLPIPFKDRPPNLPDNKQVAEGRLKSLSRRLDKDARLNEQYCNTMQDNIDNGYAHLVPKEELEGTKGKVWYLPHQPVINPMKPDKTRIVFDCASVYKGVSLNSQVLQGPDLTNNLLGVILRFRENRIALMGDIQAMFHQVNVCPRDQDVLRFLWWTGGDRSVKPEVYRMGVHLFGGTWSPSCCNFVLQRTADDNGHEFHKETVKTVKRNFYVDDCLRSVHSERDAKQLYRELTDLLMKGGFKITKWTSNNSNVLEYIPPENRAKSAKDIDFSQEPIPAERALGVYWDVGEDCFGYKIVLQDKPLSRRGLLSTVCSIYDPLGFASPFIIRAKLVNQSLCRKGVGWDEPLPVSDLENWLEWKNELLELGKLKIKRCMKPNNYKDGAIYELHHFSDASEKAYGCVAYLRTTDCDGVVHCALILSKAHLAPVKVLTIPRLELSAAVLAVRVEAMIRREVDIPIQKSVFWTDSTIVLQYVNNTEKRFKTFVANRISMIHDGSSPNQWRHVPSELNVADDVSRGLTADELSNSQRWVQGPEFLSLDEKYWPNCPELRKISTDSEVKISDCSSYLSNTNDVGIVDKLLSRRSDWCGLKKDIAWLLRYKQYLRAKTSGQSLRSLNKTLSVSDLKKAEVAILKYVQKGSFTKETLSKKTSPLRKLNVILSDDGLMLVGGRLTNAPLEYGVKHPVVLPRNHHVTSLIVRHIHMESGHVGREHVLALLREKYWIIGARQVIRKVQRLCVICKRTSALPAKQQMASLPIDRVTPDNPPFSYVGVDYFGPFMVKRGRSVEKRYGCLFTCLSIRAIHIEVVHSLDTDSFIFALQRFMARRGKPLELRSDNGTNFVGAEAVLRATISLWNQNTISNFLQQKMIDWKFNTPRASHMGGVWERMIKMTRKVLSSIMKEQVLTDEKLSTLICIVESIVNGRPLTKVSDDVRDLEPLTPNHLLLLRSGTSFPPDIFDKKDTYSKRRWRQVQYLATVFWKRWIKEYLPLLQQRQKWVNPERNFVEGDVVLLMDDDIPRNSWVMGRVVETFPGKDGLVRTVRVKTQNNNFKRPVTKLCLIEAVQQVEC